MGRGTDLRGRYRILDLAYLRGKANQKDDPRHIFYRAMLSNNTYEAYLAEVGEKSFEIDTCQYRVTGRMEIRYARRNNRIANA
jgi:hypothetical protein